MDRSPAVDRVCADGDAGHHSPVHDATLPSPDLAAPDLAAPDLPSSLDPLESSELSERSATVSQSVDELFDAPSRWRAEAARALDLHGEELIGAVSPGAGFPAVLESVLASLTPPDGRLETMVDLGAGTGGISEWLRVRTHASVVAIEPAAGAREAAQLLFPAIDVRAGAAESTGLPDGSADAAMLCGVLSLIDDAGAVLVEVERIVRAGGTLAVADLFSARAEPIGSGPNQFRSFEQVTAALAVRGWAIEEIGCGDPAPDARWAAGARRVDEWIHERRRDHPAYDAWRADGEHLDRHLRAGDLVAGCIVARRIRT